MRLFGEIEGDHKPTFYQPAFLGFYQWSSEGTRSRAALSASALFMCFIIRTALDSLYHESMGTSGRNYWTA